jgi:hypothetical protein
LSTKCVLLFPLQLFLKYISLKKSWARCDNMYIGLHVVFRVFLSDFDETWNLLDTFSINTQKIKFYENPYRGTELFHAYRRTERHFTKPIITSQLYESA